MSQNTLKIELPQIEIPMPDFSAQIGEISRLIEAANVAADRLEKAHSEPLSWSEAEAATELDISETTLIKERRNGRIRFSRVGRKPRYTREHISEYLQVVTTCEKNGTGKRSQKGKAQKATTS